jgi:RNA polymerase sigma-70 factor (ECF subfamily)
MAANAGDIEPTAGKAQASAQASARSGVRNRAVDRLQPLDHFLKDVERRAFRMAQIAVGNPDDALDIVQDTMLGFATRYANKPESDWPPLFFRVLRSRITDFYRRAAVRRRWTVMFVRDDGEDFVQTAADPAGVDPSRALGSTRAGEALNQALHELPRRQREAFMLRVWQGLSVKHTALAMGCSDGSVKTHLSRAMHALRVVLEDYRDEPR